MINFKIGNFYRITEGTYEHCSGDYGRCYYHKNSEFELLEIHEITKAEGKITKLLMQYEDCSLIFIESTKVTTILKACI